MCVCVRVCVEFVLSFLEKKFWHFPGVLAFSWSTHGNIAGHCLQSRGVDDIAIALKLG